MCIVRLVTTRQLFGLYRQLYFSFLAYYFHLLYLVHVFIYYFVVSYFAFFFSITVLEEILILVLRVMIVFHIKGTNIFFSLLIILMRQYRLIRQ